jgi:hypothetical protein
MMNSSDSWEYKVDSFFAAVGYILMIVLCKTKVHPGVSYETKPIVQSHSGRLSGPRGLALERKTVLQVSSD